MSIDKTLRSIGRDIAIETLTAERNAAIAENQLLEHTNDVLHETCAQNTKLRAERDAALERGRVLEDFADRLSEVNEPEFFYGGDHPDLMMCPACDSDGWRIGAPEKHTEDCVAVAYKAFKAAAIAEQGDAGKGEEC